MVRKILALHLVPHNDAAISLVDRRTIPRRDMVNTPNEHATCLIEVKRNPDHNWKLCVDEIELEFSKHDINGLTVELIEGFHLFTVRNYILLPTDPIIELWEGIQPKVVNVISDFRWATLSVLRRGPSQNWFECPVTILIGAPEDSSQSWTSKRSEIRQTYSGYIQLKDVAVDIIPIRFPLSAPNLYYERLLGVDHFDPRKSPMGASIQPKDGDTTATVGGSIKISTGNKTVTCMMSVWHMFSSSVTQGTEGNIMLKSVVNTTLDVVLNGISPMANSTPNRVQIPSAADHAYTLAVHQNWLEEDFVPDLEWARTKMETEPSERNQIDLDHDEKWVHNWRKTITKIQGLVPDDGYLWAGSGFSNKLDWSLICSDGREVINKPPSEEVVTSLASEMISITDSPAYIERPVVGSWSMKYVVPTKLVLKQGRSTGRTAGRISHLKTDILIKGAPEDVCFSGWTIVRNGRDFCEPGDSGAWVLDRKGDWCGMLFAQIDGVGVMLPVDKLIEDIEEKCQGKVSLP